MRSDHGYGLFFLGLFVGHLLNRLEEPVLLAGVKAPGNARFSFHRALPVNNRPQTDESQFERALAQTSSPTARGDALEKRVGKAKPRTAFRPFSSGPQSIEPGLTRTDAVL
jgi:hypothetical protein